MPNELLLPDHREYLGLELEVEGNPPKIIIPQQWMPIDEKANPYPILGEAHKPFNIVEVSIIKPTGEVVSRHTFPSRSFLQGYVKLLFVKCMNVSTTVTKTDNTTTAYVDSQIFFDYIAGAGVDTYGIVVGDNNTAVDVDQYNLFNKILTGIVSGKLDYKAMTIDATASTSDKSYRVIRRVFTNNSGAPITVKEIGVIGTVSGTPKVLHIRDVVPDQVIPDTYSFEVKYTFVYSLNMAPYAGDIVTVSESVALSVV